MGRAVKKVSPLDVFMAAIANCLATWGAAARAVPCPAVDNGSCMKKIGNPNHKYGRKSGGSSIISAVCEVLMSLTPPQSNAVLNVHFTVRSMHFAECPYARAVPQL